MIELYALEPELVATWGRRSEYRYIRDKFGLGTPRALLELPSFTYWKRRTVAAATALGLSEEDMSRLAEVFTLLEGHKCRRPDAAYLEVLDWLQNAETEYNRRPFGAIVATTNPRQHVAVLRGDRLGLATNNRWDVTHGATPKRNPAELAAVLTGLLVNATSLHLVDPHFGPENKRHREVLRAILHVLASHGVSPEVIVYCADKSPKAFFEKEAEKMSRQLPVGLEVKFIRLREDRERLHNRYVLSDLGGVTLGVGLDEARRDAPHQTDDVTLMSREQFQLRWDQYVKHMGGAFIVADRPCAVVGRPPTRRRGHP